MQAGFLADQLLLGQDRDVGRHGGAKRPLHLGDREARLHLDDADLDVGKVLAIATVLPGA